MTVDELLEKGIIALKSGQKKEARHLLLQAIQEDNQNEIAWLWLSGAVDTDLERHACLEEVLAINPHNSAAQRGLETLRRRSPRLVPSPIAPSAGDPVEGKPDEKPIGVAGSVSVPETIQSRKTPKAETTKACPFCAETIKAEAIVCRYCGKDLGTTGKRSPGVITSSEARKPVERKRRRKRPLNVSDLVCVAAAVMGACAVLFAPWPYYVNEAAFSLAVYRASEQDETLASWWAYLHSFGLCIWIPVILFSCVLVLLTLVSGRLRGTVLPWLWAIVGILGSLIPMAFYLLDYIVDDGYLVKDMTYVWGLPLAFIMYGAMTLAGMYSISQGPPKRLSDALMG